MAKELRGSVRSVQRWRRAWREAGPDAVRSCGPASRPKLIDVLFAVLEEELHPHLRPPALVARRQDAPFPISPEEEGGIATIPPA
ncbi:hypothetical protein ACFW9N_29610 [Streptomyces sp. NPDC059496]|uniref:hypothetical protein n=1 Tax=Streptomyces sp. NPDC059496 TaxID=3346851 RepID=UPI00368B6ABB